MKNFRDRKLDKVVYKLIDKGINGMGICLGMQMLAEKSEEDGYQEEGLGIISGIVKKIPENEGKQTHIGWANTSIVGEQKRGSILNGTYYFAHSYSLQQTDMAIVRGEIRHGKQNIIAAAYQNNVLGVQFHPEKSQDDGLNLLNHVIFR